MFFPDNSLEFRLGSVATILFCIALVISSLLMVGQERRLSAWTIVGWGAILDVTLVAAILLRDGLFPTWTTAQSESAAWTELATVIVAGAGAFFLFGPLVAIYWSVRYMACRRASRE
jgi:hypothetical protein